MAFSLFFFFFVCYLFEIVAVHYIGMVAAAAAPLDAKDSPREREKRQEWLEVISRYL